MTKLDQLKERLPDFARDLRINLGAIAGSTALAPAQAWGVAIASAATARNAELLAAVVEDAQAHVTPEIETAAKGAAAIMGMNNVYYRYLHFMREGGEYAAMPARLRMQIIGKPGVPHEEFELYCLAASAITGCEQCVTSHERVVREKGLSKEAVQDAVRIAAVLHGVAIALEI